jgi:hypothetical protein
VEVLGAVALPVVALLEVVRYGSPTWLVWEFGLPVAIPPLEMKSVVLPGSLCAFP